MKLERSRHKDHTPQGTPSLQSNIMLRGCFSVSGTGNHEEGYVKMIKHNSSSQQQNWTWVIVSSSNTTAQTIQCSLWRPKQILTSWGQSFLPLSVNTTELTGMHCLWIDSCKLILLKGLWVNHPAQCETWLPDWIQFELSLPSRGYWTLHTILYYRKIK